MKHRIKLTLHNFSKPYMLIINKYYKKTKIVITCWALTLVDQFKCQRSALVTMTITNVYASTNK